MTIEDEFHLGIKALIRNSQKEILLLEAAKQSYWELPGGRIQKKETVRQALEREITEEIGVQEIRTITPFLLTLTNIRIPIQGKDVGLIFAVYLCDIEIGKIKLSSDHRTYQWAAPFHAAKLLASGYPEELVEKISIL